jgi:hypothetical protein
MPIDFPSSPTTGQVYTYQGKSWVYNGTGWDSPRALSEIGAVQTFANAAARTAAIPTPTEGIYTHLNDVDRLEFYNGSAWRSPFGMTLLVNVNIPSTPSYSINDVFSSEFENYKIIFNGSTGSGAGVQCRLRSSGVDLATGYNAVQGLLTGSFSPVSRSASATATSMALVTSGAFGDKFCEATLFTPFLSQKTMLTAYGGTDLAIVSFCSSDTSGTGSYTGITFLTSTGGNLAGRLQIYGMRN